MRESGFKGATPGWGRQMKFKHEAMALAIAGVVSAALVGGDPSPAAAASGCNEVQFVDSTRSVPFTRVFTVTLNAGDTITLSDNTAVAVTDTLTVGSNTQTFSTPGSA